MALWCWMLLLSQQILSQSAEKTASSSLVIPQFGFRLDPDIIDRVPEDEETENKLTNIVCDKPDQVLSAATCGHWILNKRYIDGQYYVDGSHCEEDNVPIEVKCLDPIQHNQHYNRERKALIGQKMIGGDFIQLDNFMVMCPSIQRLPTTFPGRLTAEMVHGICVHSADCRAITCTNKPPNSKKSLNALTCWVCSSKLSHQTTALYP